MNQLKKYLITSFLFLGFFAFSLPSVYAEDHLNDLLIEKQQGLPREVLPTSSLVIDGQNGQILWEEQSETSIDPGFLTNLMTLYLTYEALEKGDIALTDTVIVSDSHQQLAQIPSLPSNNLITGGTYTIEDLIELVSFSNAVGGSFLLADRISENVDAFITRMNETAEKLGLSQTTFTNPSGISFENIQGYDTWLPLMLAGNNQSSPKDLALLAYHLINDYPAILDLTNQTEVIVQEGEFTQEIFTNQNPFIFGQTATIKGTNGLLMDLSNSERGSGIITTKQDGLVLITVILNARQNFFNEQGVDTFELIGQTLIENVFAKYEYRQLVPTEAIEIEQRKLHLETEIKGAIQRGIEPRFELSEDDNKLILNNDLPFVSDTLADQFKLPYVEETLSISEQTEDNIIVRFIMNSVEITKLTIFSIGIIPMGFLIFLMHFFIPRKEYQEQDSSSRKSRRKITGLSYRRVTFHSGITLMVTGIILLFLQYLF